MLHSWNYFLLCSTFDPVINCKLTKQQKKPISENESHAIPCMDLTLLLANSLFKTKDHLRNRLWLHHYCFVLFSDKLSLRSPAWLQTHRDLSVSASLMLG